MRDSLFGEHNSKRKEGKLGIITHDISIDLTWRLLNNECGDQENLTRTGEICKDIAWLECGNTNLVFLFLPRLTISSVILQSLPLYFLYLIDPVLPLWELACVDHAWSYIYIISLVTFHAISTLPQHNSTLSHSSLHKYVREMCIPWVVSHS